LIKIGTNVTVLKMSVTGKPIPKSVWKTLRIRVARRPVPLVTFIFLKFSTVFVNGAELFSAHALVTCNKKNNSTPSDILNLQRLRIIGNPAAACLALQTTVTRLALTAPAPLIDNKASRISALPWVCAPTP